MILPEGHEAMSDEALLAYFLEVGYDDAGAQAALEIARSGDPEPVD